MSVCEHHTVIHVAHVHMLERACVCVCVCVCVRVSVCVPMKVAFDERVYLFLGLGMKVLELMHRTTAIEPHSM